MKDLTHQALPYLNCCLFFCCYLQLLLVIISNIAACWKLWHGASKRGWTWIEPNWLWAWCKHVCLLACMYIYICNLIAMLMLSVVAPMHSCVCCCLLVSVLSSCVLYAPMHSCICSGSSCVLYVCLLPVCLCFHVWLMIVLVLVSCVLCVCLVPMHSCVWCCLLVSCMSACCLLVCAFMCDSWLCLCLYHPMYKQQTALQECNVLIKK